MRKLQSFQIQRDYRNERTNSRNSKSPKDQNCSFFFPKSGEKFTFNFCAKMKKVEKNWLFCSENAGVSQKTYFVIEKHRTK